MAITNSFLEAVKNNNIDAVRIMMKNSLLNDTTFSEFNSMEKHIGNTMPGLYQHHDGRTFMTDSNQWNPEYLDLIMAQLLSNFSHERINHIKQVIQHLYQPTQVHSNSQESSDRTSRNTTRPNKEQKFTYNDIRRRDEEAGRIRVVRTGIGTVVGGVVGGIVATKILTGVVVGAAIGAAVTYYINTRLDDEN